MATSDAFRDMLESVNERYTFAEAIDRVKSSERPAANTRPH
jgi:hypothetical protein